MRTAIATFILFSTPLAASAAVVLPEPESLALVAIGLAGVMLGLRRKK